MRTPVIVDGRGLLEPAKLREAGFEYYGLGYADMVLTRVGASALRE